MTSLVYNSQSSGKLQDQVRELIDARQFHSIAWQLMQSGKVLQSGMESVEPVSQLPQNPIYRIYSMTKPIVSFVALQLMDEQKLKLDEPVATYIPAFAKLNVLTAAGKTEPLQTPITIEHLLTHTSGLSYDFLPNCPVAEQYRDAQISGNASRALAEVIGLLTTMPLASQPGTQWRYSVSTDVLAHVLENVTGKALPELLQERVFGPLQMNDTAFYVPDSKMARLLPIYGARELGQVMVDTDIPNELHKIDVEASYPSQLDANFYRGGHGLYSTLTDYQRFIELLKTGSTENGERQLSSKLFDLMWSNKVDESLWPLVLGFSVMDGYGWNLVGRLMQKPEQSLVKSVRGEGGWSGAASTYFWIDRDNDITGIVMSQYIGSTPHLGPMAQHAAYGMFTPS